MNDAGRDREALRQQMLLRALWRDARPGVLAGWTRGGERFERGLQAYQANAGALAQRALAAAYPTIEQLLGAESFAALARAFWHRHGPVCGDLARWGAALPAFIADDAQLAGEPYLADTARLDWAVHAAETAADAAPEVRGLALLAAHDPAQLWLRLRPGTALLVSPHPVARIWQAHRNSGGDRFADVQAAFAAGLGERALVWRAGWPVRVEALAPGPAAFMAAVLNGAALGAALDAAGPDLDFQAWLAQALRLGWLAGVDAGVPGQPGVD